KLCRDFCSYCTFRISQQKIKNKDDAYLSTNSIKESLINAKESGCTEVLFTLGQSPEKKYEIARKWLDKYGYTTTIDYIHELCEMSLEVGILPHSNPGVMSEKEFSILKDVNASMGLMLETSSKKLFTDINGPHHYAPSKDPDIREKMLELAGKMHHPFTTGLLLGIGETRQDIINSLKFIKQTNDQYGHIQEIILQPFIPHKNTLWYNKNPADLHYIQDTILISSIIVPEIPLQVPPNLKNQHSLFLQSGCRDFGGISPVSIDYVNPENLWPQLSSLKEIILKEKLGFKERLPVYPKFIRDKNNNWISEKIRDVVHENDLTTPEGFRKQTR
ncbi:MAG: 7,8-didemethyl-8-hydroxy-5-deazariboflavin synthase subunit CofG, partial [Candidatus Thorarchaeota archaeon]